jgi:hypothetical protein
MINKQHVDLMEQQSHGKKKRLLRLLKKNVSRLILVNKGSLLKPGSKK